MRKIFNRNSLKLSQSCMQITLNGHNKTVQDQAGRKYISRKKGACLLERNCLSKEIVYQAKVTPDSKAETYVGLAATGFKGRFRRFRSTMKHARTAQNLANTSDSLNATSNTSPSNRRSLSRLNRTQIRRSDATYARRKSTSSSPKRNW